jgi:N-acetylneuraminate synthase
MINSNIFKDLIVLDLANNHFGDLNHAKKIIGSFSKLIKKYKIKCTIKFQFRDLDSFIHKDHLKSDNSYIKRFLTTKFSDEQFKRIHTYIKNNNILTSCTPFDEASVDKIEKMKFNFIKIASVSALDFNLHERVVKNNIPKIISTGGIKINDIDKIVSFYKKKQQKFSLMHCSSIYPSSNEKLQISVIKNLINRYKDVTIGWSTHEYPYEFRPGIIALSCGAEMFEKHIGINSKKYKLNKYSATPDLFEKWYLNLLESKKILGNEKKIIFKEEIKTINSLQRGVYAKGNISKGEKLILDKNIYFAIPLQKGQLSSSELKNNTLINKNIKAEQKILKNEIIYDQELQKEYQIKAYIHEVKAMLNYSKIELKDKFDMEISHHKGINNFKKVGCFLFNMINKKYAKKIIVMLPNQTHPFHHHKIKTESFIIISGELTLIDNKKKYLLKPGDIVHLKKSSWHKFTAGKNGCIFEEISTTSLKQDSFYKNKSIKNLDRDMRKTYFKNWYSKSK